MRFFPIIYTKELIYQIPFDYKYQEIPIFIKVIDLDINTLDLINMPIEIYNYCYFRIKRNYKGLALVNLKDKELIGYGFYSDKKVPPTNIPKLPKEAGWLFNTLILEKYRGNGFQKILISERIKKLKMINPAINIYTDILEGNIASRKSFINSGFKEAGIYYIMVLGIRRFNFLNFKIGYWNKLKRHKQL